ncbi:MAG TPA: phosphoribosylformylglycinamidine cyclo-ligase [Candidatus Eisenbacteria bacterium]
MKYREAGVDIEAGEAFVNLIKPLVKKTFGPDVMTDLGSFGGVIRVTPAGHDTLLVASIDGVGTKMLLAAEHDRLDDVGRDLVHHCVNDIAVHGARPLLFLDYIGAGRLEPERAARMVAGMADACAAQGAALLGGETAEMPGMYAEGHYDLVGAIVGTVARASFVDGSTIAAGDRLIGLASDGLHTNGYSLARRALFETGKHRPDDRPAELGGKRLLDALLVPHRCYAPSLRAMITAGELKGAAHITGGGIEGNLARILPEGVDAAIDTDSWSIPPLFRIIAAAGPVGEAEMFRAFNMGVGLVVAVGAAHEATALDRLAALGETAFALGRIVSGSGRVRLD